MSASGFSKRLSRLRRENNLSQKKVADDLGISQALLSHYENGIREPRLDFVVKICDYYGVTSDYLLCRTEVRKNPLLSVENISVPLSNQSKRDICRIIESITFLYHIIAKSGNSELLRDITELINMTLYKATRSLSAASAEDPGIFNISEQVCSRLCAIAVSLDEISLMREVAAEAESHGLSPISQLKSNLTGEALRNFQSSLCETIKIAEKRLADLLPEKE